MSKVKRILGDAFQEWLPNYARRKEAEEMEYYFVSCQVQPDKSQEESYLSAFKELGRNDQRFAIIKSKEWGNGDLTSKMQQIHTEA